MLFLAALLFSVFAVGGAVAYKRATPAIVVHAPVNPVLERIRRMGVAPDDLQSIQRHR
jgi:hypothetical protein